MSSSKLCLLLSSFVFALLLNSAIAAKKAKDTSGYKGNWIQCDKTGVGFNVAKDVLAKVVVCATPKIGDIMKVKKWSADDIEKNHPDLIPTLIKCMLQKMGFVDSATGKVLQKTGTELQAVFKQKNIQEAFLQVATDCWNQHQGAMTKDAKSYKPYMACFEHSKLNSICPVWNKIQPGNKFDPKKIQKMFG